MTSALLLLLLAWSAPAESGRWEIPFTPGHIQLDGRLDEWKGTKAVNLAPGNQAIQVRGDFGSDELAVRIQALWNKQGLHMAITWEDDVWDVRNVPRSEAVWLSPDGRRRNRLYYFDNIRLELRRKNFRYSVWISPRAEGRGPFSWSRQFGKKELEVGSSPPLISTHLVDGRVQMEWLFRWKDLRLKPKAYKDLLFRLDVADSDSPDRSLETKMGELKSLSWAGSIVFGKKP